MSCFRVKWSATVSDTFFGERKDCDFDNRGGVRVSASLLTESCMMIKISVLLILAIPKLMRGLGTSVKMCPN